MTAVSPEVIEKWRSEFEQSPINKNILADIKRKQCGEYFNFHTENKWEGFKMGRKSLVIELPPMFISLQSDYIDGAKQGIANCKKLLESQGYRVEVKDENTTGN